jgi:hypothetical protein
MTEQNHTDHSKDESLQGDPAGEGRSFDHPTGTSSAEGDVSRNPEEAEGPTAEHGGSASSDNQDAAPEHRDPNSPVPPLGYDGARFDPESPDRQPGSGPGITAGVKASWVAIGFLLGIFSLPLVYFMYLGRDRAARGAAFRFCFLGILIAFIADLAFLYFYGGDAASLLSSYGGGSTGTAGSSSGSAF